MKESAVEISLPLVGGIDTKTDSKVVLPGKMLLLENGDFTKGGSYTTRAGYTSVPARTTDGTPITDAISVAPLGTGFVLLGRRNAYVLDRVQNAWEVLGPYTPINHRQTWVANGSTKRLVPDIDTVNNVTVVMWQESSSLGGGVRCQVFDDISGAAYVSDFVLDANGERPRLTVVGNNIIATWFDPTTTAVEGKVIRTTDIVDSLNAASITIAPDCNASGQYDVCAGDNCAYLLFHQDAGVADRAVLYKLDSEGNVELNVTASSDAIKGTREITLAWNQFTNKVFVAYTDNGADVGKVKIRRYSGTDLVLEASFTEAAATDPLLLSLTPRTDGGVTRWQSSGSTGIPNAVTLIIPHDGVLAQGSTTTLRHSTLNALGWYDGINAFNIVRYTDSTTTNLQMTFYVYRDDGVLVGRLTPGQADGVGISLPRVKAYGDQWQCAIEVKKSVRVNTAVITTASVKQTPVFEHESAQRCIFDTSPPVHYATVQGVLYTSGGFMWAIDGCGPPTEAQFLQFPDQLASDIVISAGGSLTANATYLYRVYYEWQNGRGQRVRSLALTLSCTTTANRTATLTLQTLFHTRMQARSAVAIVVYRSLANQSGFFHRVSSANPSATGNNGWVANSLTADTVSFVDVMSDASAQALEIDYISNGETDHFAFDGPVYVAAVGNRVFCAGGGMTPDTPQFSLLRRDGYPLESNDTFVVSEFPEFGGDITGLADLNGVPIVFRERAIYGIEGTGPTNTRGAASDYQARTITSDVGGVPLATTRDGIFFKSAKGIYLLGQDAQITYVGAEAEGFNELNLTGAGVIPNTNSIVFVSDGGTALLYDYFYRQWGTYTNHYGQAVAVSGTDFAYLRSDGELYVRAPGVYTDAGIPYALRFRTAPLKISDIIQGSQRLHLVAVVGQYFSAHGLELKLWYDREYEAFQTITVNPTDFLDLDLWGDAADLWGAADGELWGAKFDGEDYQFEVKPKRQKFATISFEFRAIPGTDPGASLELTELALYVSKRRGLDRIPATRKH